MRLRTRFARLSTLLGAFMVPAAIAGAIQAPYTCDQSGVSCSVPVGQYGATVQNYTASPSNFSVTNNGTIVVAVPNTSQAPGGNNLVEALTWILAGVNGADSSNKQDAPTAGQNSGNLTYTNAGSITQTGNGSTITGGFSAILVQTAGGVGGSYTGTDAAQNGASSGTPGTVTFTNNAAVTVNGTANTDYATMINIVSQGAAGGSVASIGPDHNSNPQYHTANGAPGTAGNSVSVTNAAQVSVSPHRVS